VVLKAKRQNVNSNRSEITGWAQDVAIKIEGPTQRDLRGRDGESSANINSTTTLFRFVTYCMLV